MLVSDRSHYIPFVNVYKYITLHFIEGQKIQGYYIYSMVVHPPFPGVTKYARILAQT